MEHVESPAQFCASHPRVETALSCGRCDRPICVSCMTATDVRLRCRGCGPSRAARASAPPSGVRAGRFELPVGLVFVVGVTAFLIAGAHAWGTDKLTVRAIIWGGALVSLAIHEFAHGLVAYFGGDRDIKQRGYLTLNPFRFMNPGASVILPMLFVLMGGAPLVGGATLVNPHALRGRLWYSLVSVAGPLSNILTSGLIAIVFALNLIDPRTPLAAGLAYLAILLIGMAIFNMLPVPPLDGFGWLEPYLPDEVAAPLRAVGRYGYLIVIMLMMFTPLGAIMWGAAYELGYSWGLPFESVFNGWRDSSLVNLRGQ